MDRIISMLKEKLKIPPESTFILAISGGIDSMVMLSLLKKSSFNLVVVHFNHLKRTESVIEKDLVESYCQDNEIPFHYYTIKIKKGNFHHQAHQMRNFYLNEVATIHSTAYILTAHHLDDLFESILIKLTRGSNLLGYSGMQLMHSRDNFTYTKPLLYVTKQEILDYAAKHDVSYLVDRSNEGNSFLRNRYRHAVVPIMKQENEQLLQHVKHYHHQITNAFTYIRKTTISLIKKDMSINIAQFITLDQVIQDDIIAYLIEYYQLTLSSEIIRKIKKMLSSSKPNQSYKLSNNYQFVKSYNNAYIKPINTVKMGKVEVKEGEIILKNVSIFTFSHKSTVKTTHFTKLCYNKLAFPLWLRPRLDGDLLAYDYGHKKLKNLLIDLKVPTEERKKLWVLTDSNNTVLWVEKYFLNKTLGTDNELYFQIKENLKNA